MDIEESKKREREREDKAFRLFEEYLIAVITNHNSTDVTDAVILDKMREKMREFLKNGA